MRFGSCLYHLASNVTAGRILGIGINFEMQINTEGATVHMQVIHLALENCIERLYLQRSCCFNNNDEDVFWWW